MVDQEILEIKESLGRIDTKTEEFKDHFNKMDKYLFGNGQKGILDRITIIEENMEDITTDISTMAKNISDLACSVSKLNESLDTHIKDTNKHSLKNMILKKDVIIYILTGFIVFHTVIEDGGALLTIVKKLIGL